MHNGEDWSPVRLALALPAQATDIDACSWTAYTLGILQGVDMSGQFADEAAISAVVGARSVH